MTMCSLCVHCCWGPERLGLLLYFVSHFVSLSLSSRLLLFTEQWCISVLFTVQKTSLSEVKLCGHVSIIMVYSYIFNLFHVVTAVYNEGSGFYFENIQHCK